jgi:tetratricopeptide (TPR) repeat protein
MASMSLQAAYHQARQWLESNDLDRASGLAQHILSSYPNNLEAHHILGETYLAHRQLDRAQESFERVLRSDPENIPAHVGLGITFERRGQLDRAVAEFEQALEIKPDMPELRSQLLRLYSEAWGSENAQLRLSRAGLARLYAKGHMLPQAIGEFRQVIAENPQRFDARVALAETLWRNEQEDEAAAVCREILAERPESLKANLILGYLELAAGRPEGERYWQTAYQMDPELTVARALFETLPPAPEEATLPEWDENAWRRRHDEQLHEEQIAATRPIDGTTLVIDDDRDTPVLRSAASAPAPEPEPFLDDDFLASLFALDAAAAQTEEPAAPATDADEEPPMTPFSLADLGLSDDEIAGLETTIETSSEPAGDAIEADMTPFSLADLGLSDDEIAGLETTIETSSEPAGDATEADMTPFSLADLGLSDDEIAGLESIDDLTAAEAVAPAAEKPEEPELTPFSLADLGLSEDEIAGLESLQTGTTADGEEDDLPVDLQPFSMDELDLGEQAARDDFGDLPPSLQPFSLEDAPAQGQRPRLSGLPADEPFTSGAEEDDPQPSPRGFSWQQPTQRSEPDFVSSMRPRQEPVQGSIFEKLQQNRPQPPEPEPAPPTPLEADEHLGLFSLDDVSLRDDELAAAEAEAALSAVQPTPHAHQPAPEVDNLEDALASGAIQPFSFADLGLSDEEIAALGLDQAEPTATEQSEPAMQAAPEPEPPAATETEVVVPAESPSTSSAESERSHQPAPEVDNLEDALASGAIQPFSFADLGLSEEEIAALGLGQAESAATEQSEPASSADTLYLNLDDLEPAAAAFDTPAEPADPAVSSTDTHYLNLDDLEPAATFGEETAEPASDDPLAGTGDLQPFSLADLGLSDEEIGELGLDFGEEEGTRLGLTEEELAGLASGGDVDWNRVGASEPLTPSPDAVPEQVMSGDLVVDRLIALGREQGFVDIADIMAAVDDPEEQAERIEEIGQRLHEASIEIRDGDEVIDMDAEYDEDEPVSALDTLEPAVSVAGQDVAPFSLHDLGLTDEEIALLGLGGESEAPTVQADAIDLEPLPANDIGASPEPEALELAEAEAPAAEAASAEDTPATSGLVPFSLTDLGLTDDEIAMLGLGQSETPEPAAPSVPSQAVAAMPPGPPEPAPPPPPPTTAAPAPLPASESIAPTGHEVLDLFVRQLEADPQNHVLRLAIARVGAQAGMEELAVQQYRDLIRRSALLDDVVADLSDLIDEHGDEQWQRRIHKTLGDAYSKQGRFNEAMAQYSWRANN